MFRVQVLHMHIECECMDVRLCTGNSSRHIIFRLKTEDGIGTNLVVTHLRRNPYCPPAASTERPWVALTEHCEIEFATLKWYISTQYSIFTTTLRGCYG
jgi:hypothetical protein